ncbi:MAG: C-GCAxxG-C-C family (seleno)protein [Candidatus Freyarchaeota archaeon]
MTETVKNRELPEEAYRRGYEYLLKWRACAPTVFAAVMDTLGYQNDSVAEEVWKATVGLAGGTGNMAIGTCGAMAGAAAAISYSFGYNKEEIQKDITKMLKICGAVAEVGKKMQEKYGHIVCQEVQFHHWGKAYRFTHPEAALEFIKMWQETKGNFKCQEVTADLAKWATEKILEYNPQFSKRKKA